ncbi:hypothetical protein BCR41DRAFT_7067 [Lobosporangium transversale]|uniref:F-box domain-containing protein n=1 Tax=Lobosporangium transversale TaxID=64571 RepID=A0A1Y2H585_9FUNG|nr:hypothetical protein BCR41DRAFT_7067 [Lobosporangium transversale]ORZ28873.1 hypothetical protein BCR41DRAFT_7067 [Lobosporangium transversale]|eukprot:XP_021886546.1 hypothetical protein BCR41DRAFT_7067 [Lobosporangium transversale]
MHCRTTRNILKGLYLKSTFQRSMDHCRDVTASTTSNMLCLDNTQSSPGLWETILRCTNLERLEISHTRINDEVDLFLQVCKKLRHLGMDGVAIHQLPISILNDELSNCLLTNIRTLYITGVEILNPPHPYTPSYCLGLLVRKCLGLCALKFVDIIEYRRSKQPKHDDFYRAAFLRHPWALTNLSDLSFPHMRIKDRDMAALLSQMTRLRRLNVPFCGFDQLSLQELLADKRAVLGNGHMV